MIVWQDLIATDNSGGVLDISCDRQSGENFSIGQTAVTCKAIDGSENRAHCQFRVHVTGPGVYYQNTTSTIAKILYIEMKM